MFFNVRKKFLILEIGFLLLKIQCLDLILEN